MLNRKGPQLVYIVGPIGSGKSTIVKWIMTKLDIIRLQDNCPCVYDPTRRLYLLGRYKHFHGPSKKYWEMEQTGLFLVLKQFN